MLKVVLYCSVADEKDRTYTTGGSVHHLLESKSGQKLDFHGFGGVLKHGNFEKFVNEGRDADLIITDAWSYPASGDPEEVMYSAIAAIRRENPDAIILSQLMEGTHLTAAHRIGKPFVDWMGPTVLSYLALATAIKNNEPGQPLDAILVVDDDSSNRYYAHEQMPDDTVITLASYLDAIDLIGKYSFRLVMTDMMMPCEKANQGHKGLKFVGQLSHMGVFVAIKASNKGIPVVVVSDTGHHDHPAGHVAELMSSGAIKWICGCKCQLKDRGDGQFVKDWAKAKESIS